MNENTQTFIKYRLERAQETLAEAHLLFSNGYMNAYINRLYYACFYAVSALLLTKGLSTSKHAGVRSLFHQNFVKTGEIEISAGKLYDRLFDNRHKGDYEDLIHFDPNEVGSWFEEAQEFVKTLEKVVQKTFVKNSSEKECQE